MMNFLLKELGALYQGNEMRLSQKQVRLYRYLCMIAAIVVPGMGLYHHISQPESYDPLVLRMIVAFFCAGIVVMSYFVEFARRYMLSFVYVITGLFMTWFVFLTTMNAYRFEYVIGMFAVFIGLFTVMKRYTHLIGFAAYAVLANIYVYFREEDLFVNPLYVAALFAIMGVAYAINLYSREIMSNLIHKQRQLMNSIFEESVDAMLLFKLPEGEIVKSNAVADHLFLPDDSIRREEEHILDFLLTRSEQKLLDKTPDNGRHLVEKEVDLRKWNGKSAFGELVVTVISGASERLFLIRLIDVTDRKSREEAIGKYAGDLEETKGVLEQHASELNQTVNDLRDARAKAESAVKAKGDFLANMSHELRTPLNGILGMTSLALSGDLDAEQRDYFETIENSGLSLRRIVNDILDFSNMESGNLKLSPSPFSLRTVVSKTIRLLANEGASKGIELACWVDEAIPDRLIGDANRLRQLLLNLCGNAVKFTQQGQVLLQIHKLEAWDRRIRLRGAVCDSGIGVDASKREMIFESFSQEDGSMTRRYGGTGLGLTLVQQLVRLMDGKIWVESPAVDNGLWKNAEAAQDAANGRPGSVFYFEILIEIDLDKVENEPAVSVPVKEVAILQADCLNRKLLQRRLESIHGRKPKVFSDAADFLREQQNLPSLKDWLLIIDPQCVDETVAGTLRARLSGQNLWFLTGPGGNAPESVFGLAPAFRLMLPLQDQELLKGLASLKSPVSKPEKEVRSPEPPRKTGADKVPEPEVQNGGLNILLAEDNKVNQKLMTRLLAKMGHRVSLAENGREAVDKWRDDDIDIIIMDIQMPEMDGYEATIAIRTAESGHVPIVALTANAMKGDRERCLDAGMDDYLTKPVDVKRLTGILQQITEMVP